MTFAETTPKSTQKRLNAMHSLYGSGDPERDRARRNIAKSMISPGTDRPQEIYTPQSVIDVVLATFGEIVLDPCSGPDSIVPARIKYDGTAEQWDGLLSRWFRKTYFNPPYKNLRDWLIKADAEASQARPIIGLFPVRPHRKWFRDLLLNRSGVEIVYLDPLKFRGYDQAFPAPLCLVLWCTDSEMIRRFLTASKALSK